MRRLGGDWLDAGETAALAAPSVVLPVAEEQNVVLNPAHEGIDSLVEVARPRATVDPRLTGGEVS